jgi:hypothetical protein
MACDPSTGKVYLFGGYVCGANGGPGQYFDDLWCFDPIAEKWTELRPTGKSPSGRKGHAMVYDPSTGKVFLFGGYNYPHRLGDFWAYDPVLNHWSRLYPTGDKPGACYYDSMVCDTQSGRVILYEGQSNELWSYDPVLNHWTQLHAAGGRPRDREGAGVAFDSRTSRVLVFGGNEAAATELSPMDDLWAYDISASSWTALDPTGEKPVARTNPVLAYDPAGGLTILFGGEAMDSYPETLWAYDSAANAWKKLQPAGRFPYGRYGAAMVYDPKIGGMVMFGGHGSAPPGYLSGTWALTP